MRDGKLRLSSEDTREGTREKSVKPPKSDLAIKQTDSGIKQLDRVNSERWISHKKPEYLAENNFRAFKENGHDAKVLVSEEDNTVELSKEIVLKDILEKAKPVLPDEVESLLAKITEYHQQKDGCKLPDYGEDQYISDCKEVAKLWSPASWKEFADRRAEFVIDRWPYAKSQFDPESKSWRFCLPEKTTKPEYVKDMFLRFNDECLTLRHDELLADSEKTFNADLEVRSNVTARSLEMNLELGDKRWPIEDYPLAKRYDEDCRTGITEAFNKGKITKDTPKDMVRKIGCDFARDKIIERNTPKDDVPAIFLNALPGGYFEELDRFRDLDRKVVVTKPIELAQNERDQLNKNGIIEIIDDKTLKVNRPVKVGTEEWTILMKFLEAREKQENGQKSTLKAAVLPNKEIWVLPYRFEGKEKTKHSIAANGEPCVWAGEVDFEDGKLKELKGDSGHYKTYDSDPIKQKAIFQFAVSTFKEAGYENPELEDVSLMGVRHKDSSITDVSKVLREDSV